MPVFVCTFITLAWLKGRQSAEMPETNVELTRARFDRPFTAAFSPLTGTFELS